MAGIDLFDRLPRGLNLRLRDINGYYIVDREITGQDEGGITVRIFYSTATIDILDLTGELTVFLEHKYHGDISDYALEQLRSAGINVEE